MGGPSQASKDNAKAQAAFYKQATTQQTQTFGEDQQILKDIEGVTLPLLSLGPNQWGFSEPEFQDLQNSIIENTSQATKDVVNATQLAIKQKTGGTNLLPTGGEEELEENARILGGQTRAKQLSDLRLAGYQQGRQNYQMALGALTGEQQMLDPSKYTTAATGAGGAATSATQLMDSERSNLLSSVLGGALGAAGTAFAGPVGGAIGGKLGKAIGG